MCVFILDFDGTSPFSKHLIIRCHMEVEQLQDCKVSRKPEDLLKGKKLAKQSFQKMFQRIQVGKIQLGKILFGKIQFGKYSLENIVWKYS